MVKIAVEAAIFTRERVEALNDYFFKEWVMGIGTGETNAASRGNVGAEASASDSGALGLDLNA